MPIEIAPISRRSFLARSAAIAGSLAFARQVKADATDIETLALCSDTHIAADPNTLRSDVNMSANFKKVLQEIIGSSEKPGRLLVNGDCAYLTGQPGDYQTFLSHLTPVREAGIPIALALGNHDDRAPFRVALKETGIEASPIPDKQVAIVPTKHANWFLLDSLESVNSTPGLLGQPQLDWLSSELTKHGDKPAFVMAHHNVEYRKHLKSGEVVVAVADRRIPAAGLIDDEQLLEVLTAHPNVAAFFCGHTHQWNVVRWKDISFVNLPCTAYPFLPADPNGWVLCRHGSNEAEIEIRTLDPKHAAQGQKVKLPYRGA
jgi:3',5'-cyclic AMP phosphodiesterase CpdA